jgi:hypothetical protein
MCTPPHSWQAVVATLVWWPAGTDRRASSADLNLGRPVGHTVGGWIVFAG